MSSFDFHEFFFGWICYIIINFFAKFHRNLLTLPVLCISESCIEIEINLNFYCHTSLWCFKRFYQGLWGLHKTFRGTTKKSENKHLVNFFFEFFFFCGMVDQQKAFTLISSWHHCQRSSPSWISNMLRAGFEPVQNLISGLVEWSCAAVTLRVKKFEVVVYTSILAILGCSQSCLWFLNSFILLIFFLIW